MRSLCTISGAVGLVWATTKAFFNPSLEAYLGSYFLPIVALTGLLFVPTTNVKIEDVIHDKSVSVSHVPLLLARMAEMTSSIGYQLTKGIEGVMHVANDASYNATGMIFGSESALDTKKYEITDGNLAQNFKRFCKQCVLYDIALGSYNFVALIVQCMVNKSLKSLKLIEKRKSDLDRFQQIENQMKNFNEWRAKKLKEIYQEAIDSGFEDFMEFSPHPEDLFGFLLNKISHHHLSLLNQEYENPNFLDVDHLQDEYGVCTGGYSYSDICDDCELDEKTVREEISWLLEKGFIERKKGNGMNAYPWWYRVINQNWIQSI